MNVVFTALALDEESTAARALKDLGWEETWDLVRLRGSAETRWQSRIGKVLGKRTRK